MKPELTWEYLQSIEPEPLTRFVRLNAEAWLDQWKKQCSDALDSDLVGIPLYDAWPSSSKISADEWQAKLDANWARLAEYDRLTAERKARNPQL